MISIQKKSGVEMFVRPELGKSTLTDHQVLRVANNGRNHMKSLLKEKVRLECHFRLGWKLQMVCKPTIHVPQVPGGCLETSNFECVKSCFRALRHVAIVLPSDGAARGSSLER